MDKSLDILLDEMGITPGPWGKDGQGSCGHLVARKVGIDYDLVAMGNPVGPGGKANATLLAQSRELLKALIAISYGAYVTQKTIAIIEAATPPAWTWERITKRLEEFEG